MLLGFGLAFTASGVIVAGQPVAAAVTGTAGLVVILVAVLGDRSRRAVDPMARVDRHFDPTTDLPHAAAVPLVLADPSASRTLTGRAGLVSIELLGGPAAAAMAGAEAVEMLAAVTTHRLQSRGWVHDSAGPFGPIIFRRAPYGFVVLLRDVLDPRTTRWLAGRLLQALSSDVRCGGTVVSPEPVVGIAIGSLA
ncbi:MAG: hypothetical protein ACE5GB_12865, partial [Acidimicrobiales bacterium]